MKSDKKVTGFRLIWGYLGVFLMLIGVLTAVPLIILAFYPSEYLCWIDFTLPAGIDVVVGFLLFVLFIARRKRERFARFEESHLLVLVWVFAMLSGAAPFFVAGLRGKMSMNFSEAFFESASAYSTTGLSCFKDFVDGKLVFDGTSTVLLEGQSYCPHVFTFHRSLMQFVGGAGLVLVLTSVLGSSGGMSLYVSEGHSDQLLPNIGKSAKLIFGIYSLYTVLGAFALFFAGVDAFDSVCISMCALSGGGMTPRSGSIGAYRAFDGTKVLNGIFTTNSLAIDIVMMVLVLLSGISFVLHTFILRAKWKKFLKDDETKFAIGSIAAGVLISVLGACVTMMRLSGGSFFTNFGENVRDSFFYVIGSATNSGFANTDTSTLLSMGKPILIVCVIMMVIGGGAGSTAGGIKQYRVFLCAKNLFYSLRYRFAPDHQLYPKLTYRHGQERELDEGTISEASNYSFLFIGLLVLLTAIACHLPEIDIEQGIFDVASAQSNTGLSLTDFVRYGSVYGNEYHVLLWDLSVGMVLGRLEILPLFFMGRNIREEFHYQHTLRRRSIEAKKRKA